MPLFKGSRPQSRSFPQMTFEKPGTYAGILSAFSNPFWDEVKCARCNSKGQLDGEECRKCRGTGIDKFQKLRITYAVPGTDWVAEEDVRKSISDERVNKANQTISASTLYLRLSMLTGISDPDLLEDVDEEKLLGQPVEITIGLNKTKKYLRILDVNPLGTNASVIGAPPAAQARSNGGLQHPLFNAEGMPPRIERTGGPVGFPDARVTIYPQEAPLFDAEAPPSDETPPDEESPFEPPSKPQIEIPSIAQLKDMFEATGRNNEDEFKAWFQVETGYAKSVTAQMKLDLARKIKALHPVGPKSLGKQMQQANLEYDINEEVPF